jgi:thiol:disulfide interchange protein DsbD
MVSSFSLPAAEASSTRMNTQTANFAVIFPTQRVRPGSEIEGLIQFYLDPGWHLYWKNPGDTGIAPTFDWQLPEGIRIKDIKWPVPLRLERAGTVFYGYEKTPPWVVTIAFDDHLAEGIYPITLSAFWLACDGSCVPASQQFEFSFAISSSATPPPPLPALIEAKQKLPIPLEAGNSTIVNEHLIIQIPIQKEKTAQLNNIIVFPESEGIIAVTQLPVWKRVGDAFEISLFCLPTATDTLIQAKHFIGLVQLISTTKEVLATYALNIPYETSTSHAFDQSTSAISQESQWLTVDVSKDLQALHVGSAMRIILLMAFLGGILLNFTPCVLPVVGLKVLNLISFRTLKGFRTLSHGLVFTFGILVTFWILAGGLYLLEYLGATIGWGFQLQEPHFVIALTILLFCFALNLFGVFEIGTSVSAWASEIEEVVGGASSRVAPSHLTSFASGVLATLIATPCTGPLLGSVIGFASTFQPIDGLILFTVIGLGMAFPFLVITAFPILIRLLPRPGPWMITVKQFLGFCLLATIAWLLWVLDAEVPSLSLSIIASGLIVLAFGLWIFGHWGNPVRSIFCRFAGRLFALMFVLAGVFILIASIDNRIMPWVLKVLPEQKTIQWETFSKERLEQELAKGNTVFVEFSAKWCLTCQTNKLSFVSHKVVEAFTTHHIVALEADWTNGDPRITAMLRSLGRNGVPVYAIFKSGKEPMLLPEIVTPDIIVNAVSEKEGF